MKIEKKGLLGWRNSILKCICIKNIIIELEITQLCCHWWKKSHDGMFVQRCDRKKADVLELIW